MSTFYRGIRFVIVYANDGIKWWKKYMNLDTSKWKNYGYSHEHTEKFFQKDWGISHSVIFTNHLDIQYFK